MDHDDMGLDELEAAVHSIEDARHELAPVRFSDLKAMSESPAHYLHRLRNRGRQGRRAALDVGTVAHGLILGGGPEVLIYEGTRNGRHKAYASFVEEHPGALILSPAEHAAATGIARAVEQCRAAVELLEGVHEQELPEWEIAGRRCGGRPDVLHPRRVVELKTSMTTHPYRFKRLALRMHYHGQLAWYLDGHRARGGTASEAYIVAVESSPPYAVTPLEVTPRALDMGRRLARLWLEQLLVCEQTGEWPGYVTGVVQLDVEDDGPLDLVIDGDSDSGETAADWEAA